MSFKKSYGRTIIIREGQSVERAISTLKKAMMPIIKEVRERQYFEKPSLKRRKKRKEAIRLAKKRQQQFKEFHGL